MKRPLRGSLCRFSYYVGSCALASALFLLRPCALTAIVGGVLIVQALALAFLRRFWEEHERFVAAQDWAAGHDAAGEPIPRRLPRARRAAS